MWRPFTAATRANTQCTGTAGVAGAAAAAARVAVQCGKKSKQPLSKERRSGQCDPQRSATRSHVVIAAKCHPAGNGIEASKQNLRWYTAAAACRPHTGENGRDAPDGMPQMADLFFPKAPSQLHRFALRFSECRGRGIDPVPVTKGSRRDSRARSVAPWQQGPVQPQGKRTQNE